MTSTNELQTIQPIAKTQRNIGIDLLRVVSMFMVIILHVFGWGNLLSSPAFSLKAEVLWFLETLCYCAVNVYAIISGFVGYKSKPKTKRLLSIWLQVILYSVLFGLVSYVYRWLVIGTKMGIIELAKCFFPLLFDWNWYFSAYVILFLFMPLLNLIIEKTSKQALATFLVVIFAFLCFLPNDTFGVNGGYSAFWLILLYLLGGYLAKYKPLQNVRSCWLVLLYLACVCANYSTRWIAKFLSINPNVLLSYQSPFILLSAIFLVLGFSKIQLNDACKKIVCFLSPLTFGVFIIHTSMFLKKDILPAAISPANEYGCLAIVGIVFGSALAVFVVCALIEFCRIKLFNLLKIDKLLEKISNLLGKVRDFFIKDDQKE